jgi:putative transposase
MQLTYRYRIKDKHARRLKAQARAVNFVWNYANETQRKAARDGRKWLSGYDLWKLVAGASNEGLDLHSHSAMRVCVQYDKSRRQQKKPWLRWRSRKSLGWVPFNTGHAQLRDGGFVFRGERYEVSLHRALPNAAKIGAGSFSQDTRGRWYINCPVEIAEATEAPLKYVGIDLGLKDLATPSTGEKIEMPRFYRRNEEKLGTSQRARKTKRARTIHAKVANRRKDFLHKASSKLAKQYGLIVVGDVSPSKLAQTKMAKSVLDAGWSRFKDMLSWKLRLRSGGMLLEVSEHLSSQVCSECGCLPPSRPRGIADLGIREWTCSDCGAIHDRDTNAARNILRCGLAALAEGAHRV